MFSGLQKLAYYSNLPISLSEVSLTERVTIRRLWELRLLCDAAYCFVHLKLASFVCQNIKVGGSKPNGWTSSLLRGMGVQARILDFEMGWGGGGFL